MERIASIMKLYPGYEEEYKERHDNLWPEMESALKDHGATNYSIFLEKETGNLFAYLEVENTEKYNEIANTEICQRWWEYMAPLMETRTSNEPISIELVEVFHLD